ncbi:alkaline phosphatase [Alterisphingorhabdus coralli]|uniref:Alkaline phosphatase n=1 Tax=Alterisphingorhabdus coralli TaxID=3071408 RepID=A0AA97I0L1_9SPHN|nr:alkaline phosphatase [Parasphingorhabdus sp. SCSIO 66989]WOE75077.1 alkaline phosphatase [Parasphingorhabdus sp. SCSIO 66989]
MSFSTRHATLIIAALSLPVSTTGWTKTEETTHTVTANDAYYQAGETALAQHLEHVPNTNQAKNLILFIGDGMGVSTITAGRIYMGQAEGGDGPSFVTPSDAMPYAAMVKTYSHDFQVADSAATATAIVSGVKARSGTLGVTSEVERGDCASGVGKSVPSLFDLARQAGRDTGVISTARITHATPASTYAHSVSRDWENDGRMPEDATACKDIALQLVEWDEGRGMDLAMGGGRASFLPTSMADPEYPEYTGVREDGRNLVAEWQSKNPQGLYVYDMAGFKALDAGDDGPILGLFETSHMQYEADRILGSDTDQAGEPSLSEMVALAITKLSKNPRGFVLMVEGARIDHAHHAGNAARALIDTQAFEAAIKTALETVNMDETLVLVTADHSHVFTIAGYQPRDNPILGQVPLSRYTTPEDGKPYTTLGYANGPGAKTDALRADLTETDTTALDYKQQALVPLGSETHGGEDVVIKAQGPRAYLFRGTIEQNVIFHIAKYALGL